MKTAFHSSNYTERCLNIFTQTSLLCHKSVDFSQPVNDHRRLPKLCKSKRWLTAAISSLKRVTEMIFGRIVHCAGFS
jgi:hypothetical protein